MKSNWSCVDQFRKPGSDDGCFQNCRGIDISKKTGNMILCDINNKRIQVLDENGKFLYSWYTEVKGSRLCPLNVTRYDENTLMVAMEGHATLWSYPDIADGKEAILLNAFGNEHLVFPRSCIRNQLGEIFVSDVGRHCVNMYDQNGLFITSIGSLGTDDSRHFNWPYYMCMDDHGRLAVADSHNRCIKLFDNKTLKYLTQFGKDKFTCPTGFTYNSQGSGYFYATDYDTCQMFNYSSDGEFIEVIDKSMPTTGSGVDLTRHNDVIVTVFDGYLKYKNIST